MCTGQMPAAVDFCPRSWRFSSITVMRPQIVPRRKTQLGPLLHATNVLARRPRVRCVFLLSSVVAAHRLFFVCFMQQFGEEVNTDNSPHGTGMATRGDPQTQQGTCPRWCQLSQMRRGSLRGNVRCDLPRRTVSSVPDHAGHQRSSSASRTSMGPHTARGYIT